MYRIGLCYRDGEGAALDAELAMFWLRKAAEKGVQDAKKALQSLPALGVDVNGGETAAAVAAGGNYGGGGLDALLGKFNKVGKV